jgi:hypothetical protein
MLSSHLVLSSRIFRLHSCKYTRRYTTNDMAYIFTAVKNQNKDRILKKNIVKATEP